MKQNSNGRDINDTADWYRIFHLRLVLVAVLALSSLSIGASELTFNSSGAPTSLVLGGVSFLNSSNGGIEVTNGGSTVALQSVVTTGNTVVVTANGGAVFTLQIDTYDNHLAIHLMDIQGVGTGEDYSLRIELDSDDNAAYTLNDLMTTSGNDTLIWPYLWGRVRPNGTHGSVVLYNGTLSGSALDAVLAEIWSVQGTAGHMTRPNVASWTEADVLAWVDEWVERYQSIAKVSVGANTPEELYEMTNDIVIPNGANRVYLFSSVWRVNGQGLMSVREAVFPAGQEDLIAYQEYLGSHGIDLQLKSLSPQVSASYEMYISPTFVEPRIMRWGQGTLENAIGTTETTIQVRISAIFELDNYSTYEFMRVGNEMIQFDSISQNGDVWTMTGCERGYGASVPHSHSAGTEMAGAVLINGNFNFEDDFGFLNSLAEEICYPYGDFLNAVGTGHIHFDGTGRMEQYPWYVRDFTDAVYSRIDHPVTTSKVGGQIEANFERYFSKALPIAGSWGYRDVPIRPRLHQEGRKHTELCASILDMHFDAVEGIQNGSRRASLLGGQSGAVLSMDTLEGFGMTDQAIELFKYWIELTPVFDDEDVDYIDGFLMPNGNHWMGEDVLVLSKNEDCDYIFTPHRVMGRTSGEDWVVVVDGEEIYNTYRIDQEWGAVPRFQDITTGTTMELYNPYQAQPLQVIVRVDSDAAVWQDPFITVNGTGTLSVVGDIQPLEYMKYDGGDTVSVYDENWNLERTLTATATNFTVNKGNNTVTTAAGSGSSDLHTQFITLGPVYVLKSNDFVIHQLPVPKNVALNGTATQSSTYHTGGFPELAIDGNTDGEWSNGSVTHTEEIEEQHWWQVDLGAPYAIDEIQVWGRTGKHAYRLSNYDVSILDCSNNVVWSNYQASYPDPSVSLNPEGARGRFVKIQLRGTDEPLSLAEVRVFSASPAGYCGDLARDGQIDLRDVAELSAGWQSQPGYTMDDLLHIANDWLVGTTPFVLSFDGVDDYVKIPGFTGISGGQARTTCAWIRTSQMGGSILSYGDGTSLGDWLFLVSSTGALQLGVSGGNIKGTTFIADDQWHHVAAVLEAPPSGPSTVQDLRLYVDGTLENGTYANPGLELNTGSALPVQIGTKSNPQNYFYQGLIDDVRIYDRALSDIEIGSIGNVTDGLVAHWNLNEGRCYIVQDFASGHDGIIYGADWLSLLEYQLTVTNGSGSGEYMQGTVVSISADAAPSGYQFTGWAGDVTYVADAGDPTTTVTMPAEDVELTATYQQVTEGHIVWQPAVAISSASDVSLDGDFVEAIALTLISSPPASYTANGVVFTTNKHSLMPNGTATTDADFWPSGSGDAYDHILSSAGYSSTSETLDLGGGLLEVGSSYQIQLWYVDHRDIGTSKDKSGRRMTFEDENGNVSDPINGHTVIGEFTADSTSVEITITATAGTDDAHLNAYQIRKLSSE